MNVGTNTMALYNVHDDDMTGFGTVMQVNKGFENTGPAMQCHSELIGCYFFEPCITESADTSGQLHTHFPRSANALQMHERAFAVTTSPSDNRNSI